MRSKRQPVTNHVNGLANVMASNGVIHVINKVLIP